MTLKQSIEGGQEQSVSLPEGTAAVRLLSLKLGSYEDANVTRHVVLRMSFDEKETVYSSIACRHRFGEERSRGNDLPTKP